jgi:hypothetical protein
VRSVIKTPLDAVAENGPAVAPGTQGPAVVDDDELDELDELDDGAAVVEELVLTEPLPHPPSTAGSATTATTHIAGIRLIAHPFPCPRRQETPRATRTGPKYHRTSGTPEGGMP